MARGGAGDAAGEIEMGTERPTSDLTLDSAVEDREQGELVGEKKLDGLIVEEKPALLGSEGDESQEDRNDAAGENAKDSQDGEVQEYYGEKNAGEVASADTTGTAVDAQGVVEEKKEDSEDDEKKYPGGFALGILTFGLCMATFVVALDNTIIGLRSLSKAPSPPSTESLTFLHSHCYSQDHYRLRLSKRRRLVRIFIPSHHYITSTFPRQSLYILQR
jgi:hypothetical protein